MYSLTPVIAGKVAVNILSGFASGHTKLPAKAEIADAIDDAKIYGLCLLRMKGVTSSMGTPKISEAVLLWISWP